MARRGLSRRRLGLVAVVSVLVNGTVAVWLLVAGVGRGEEAVSAAEVASGLEFTVERRVLTEETRLTVTVETVSGSTVTAPGGEPAVVTEVLVAAGDEIEPGAQLARLNGRPLWALPIRFPLYRDIEPGATGDDVAALQSALNALDPSPGLAVDGEFGPSTQDAFEALYTGTGLEPDRVTATDTGLPDLEATVAAVQDRRDDLAADPDTPTADVDAVADELAAARRAVTDAEARVGIVIRRGDVIPVADRATVLDVPLAVGQTVTAEQALFEIGQLSVRGTATVSTIQAEGLATGQVAVPDDPALPTGTITALEPDGGGSVTVTIDFGAVTTDPGLQSAALTLTRDLTPGPVLALPAAVVFVAADGARTIRIPDTSQADGWRTVEIETGTVAGGYVEITTGPLHEGDTVLGG